MNIELTDLDKDALIEIANVGMCKAAKQLSLLLNQQVNIAIPELELFSSDEFDKHNHMGSDDRIFYVYQRLSGDMAGVASLLFKRESTRLLTKPLVAHIPTLTTEEAQALEKEALLEIGNIVISFCISAIVSMCRLSVKLTLPEYAENTVNKFIHDLSNCLDEDAKKMLTLSTTLETSSQEISGQLILLLPEESLCGLLSGIRELLGDV